MVKMAKLDRTDLITPKELRRAISDVLPCVDKWSSQAVFQHILFELKDGILTLVATDRFRMAYTALRVNLPDGERVVHHTDARELRDNLKKAKEVEIRINGEDLAIDIIPDRYEETFTVNFSKQDNIKYLAWRKYIIPTSFSTQATFSAQAMKRALRGIHQKSEWVIKLEIAEGKIKLRSRSEEEEELKEAIIPAQVEGDSIKIAFDGTYLRQMVNTLGREIILKTVSPSGPALFQRDKTNWIIMPMLITW